MASTGWATSCAASGRHVFTEGRRKDLINRGGEKISCEEVENLIYAHPKVKVVDARRDARSGVRRKGVRVRRAEAGRNARLRRADQRSCGNRRSRRFKLPERLEVVAELPLSPVGKILKRELRERITEMLAREARQRAPREHRHRRRRPRRTLLRVPDEAARSGTPHPDRRARFGGRDLRLGRGVHRHRAGVRP